jgi:chaperonin cofactor prefoldin
METIINNLNKQINELSKQDDKLRTEGFGWFFLERENIRACMKDIKKVIKTLETIK